MTNPYCETLGIEQPVLEAVKDHPEANTYTLMMVALLEHGGPMTLEEVAERFARAGVAVAPDATRSLKRCRPARAPIYRDGDHYSLDPHDDDLDLWAFRLGLRPPRVPVLRLAPPPPEPLPGPEVPLTIAELEEAFRGAYLFNSWSAQRLALAVLDCHGGCLPADRVLEVLNTLTPDHSLRKESAQYWHKGAAVKAVEDGTWEMNTGHPALPSAREAVRKRIEVARRWNNRGPDPATRAAHRLRIEARRAQHAAELARLRRVLVHAFPKKDPKVVILVDVETRELSYFEGQLEPALSRLAEHDLIAAVEVRPLLKALGFDPQDRRLAELGPHQKTRRLNRRGRTLKITTKLLVQGSCGISRPFGDPAKMRGYLRGGQMTRLRRRLEADVKSLFALYQYGRLHGAVRLRWGFFDEMHPVPWKLRDEPVLYHLKEQAHEDGEELEVVIGSAPGWAEPWSRAHRCLVVTSSDGYRFLLVGEDGLLVDDRDVQLARRFQPGSASS